MGNHLETTVPDPTTPVRLRFYQLLLDWTSSFDLTAVDLPEPYPTRVFRRVLVTPDEVHHLCSATPSLWVEHLDWVPFWEGKTRNEVGDEVAQEWESLLEEGAEDFGDYLERSALVKTYTAEGGSEGVTWDSTLVHASAFQEEVLETQRDHLLDYARGNALV